jgi:O-antigen ligase
MFINKSKNIYLRLILFLIATIAVLNLFFLSSRATFLSLIIIFVFYFFQKIFFELRRLGFFNLVKRFIYIPFIFIISFYVFDNNSKENDRSKIQNRVASISMQDESASQRIRYYTQAIVYASQHPLMGTGIGNWKIKSVDVDKDNIYSYIIPYVMHNDFLEILVETNLLGLLSYLLFFLSIYWILYKGYMKTKDVDLRDSLFLTACALTVYFIDANLNFPLYRPIMQINLLLILIISLHLNLNISKNENKKKL